MLMVYSPSHVRLLLPSMFYRQSYFNWHHCCSCCIWLKSVQRLPSFISELHVACLLNHHVETAGQTESHLGAPVLLSPGSLRRRQTQSPLPPWTAAKFNNVHL
jgi:hypothetical protein